MPCPSAAEPPGRRRDHRFVNYIQRVDGSVESYWTPASLPEIVYIVQEAERQGKRVHPVGTGWSFEDLAYTPDWMVDLRALGQILPRVDPATGTRPSGLVDRGPHTSALSEYWRLRQYGRLADTSSQKLVHVEAGARLFDLCTALATHYTNSREGLALPTMGGASGQRLAGVISTSTHGSDYQLPPFCDLVHAVHLVTTGGRELWIERASRPLTVDDGALRAAIGACADLEIIRDDELLDAVTVGMGRFGIIYSFVLEVTPAFRLAEYSHRFRWREVADALAAGVGEDRPFNRLGGLLFRKDPPWDLRISGAPNEYRYLDVIFNTRKPADCWVRRRWITRDSRDLNVAGASDVLCEPGIANLVIAAASAGLKGYSTVLGATVFLLPKAVEVQVRAAELDALTLDPHLTLGQAMAASVNAIAGAQMGNELMGLIDEITAIQFNGQLGPSETTGVRGPSWQVAAGYADPATTGTCYRGNSIEVMFGLDSRRYLDFLDAVLAEAPRHVQAGYIALRFSRRSTALLSMHNVTHPVAASIEITSLHGLVGNPAWFRWLEETALRMGGRLHWGQQNNLQARQVQRHYGDALETWRRQLYRVVGTSATFSNAFTVQRGLEPAVPSLVQAAWVHGHRARIERPGQARVTRTGYSARIYGNGGTDNWIHLAIPTPVIVDDVRLAIGSVLLRYRVSGTAHVHAVHVYDGERRIAAYDGRMDRPTEWRMDRFAVPDRPQVYTGLGISVGVRFPTAGSYFELSSGGGDFIS